MLNGIDQRGHAAQAQPVDAPVGNTNAQSNAEPSALRSMPAEDMRKPSKSSGLFTSALYSLGFAALTGASGVAILFIAWEGLKDKFANGVSAKASGSANIDGAAEANGDFQADAQARLDDLEAGAYGFDFGVPGNGSSSVDANGQLDFDGNIHAENVDVGLDNATVAADIGMVPLQLVLCVAAVFCTVGAAFGCLLERHVRSSKKHDELASQLQDMRNENQAHQAQVIDLLNARQLEAGVAA